MNEVLRTLLDEYTVEISHADCSHRHIAQSPQIFVLDLDKITSIAHDGG